MNEYALLYLDSALARGTPEAFFSLLFLGLGRILPIIQLSPFFGSRTLPLPAKVAFGIALFGVFFPSMVVNMTEPVYFNARFVLLILKEAFVGFSLGMLMAAPFSIAQNVGMIIDHQRGGASLMVNDPTIQNQSSPLGTLFNLVLICVFYYINGPFYFIDAISKAYEIVPPDHLINPTFFNASNPFWIEMIRYLNSVMVITIQLVAPPLIVTLMTDMFLGIINRLAPQVQIIFLGLPLKSLLALFMIFLGYKAYNEQTVVVIFQYFEKIKQALYGLALGHY